MSTEVAFDLPPMIRVYKDGRIERFVGNDIVPPSVDSLTGVQSKDVMIDPQIGVSARLFIPKLADPVRKLPLLVYFHGGGFCIESAFSPTYHNYLNSQVAEAGVFVVSVDYRRAPEHPLPIAYDDSWTALKWVASHAETGSGPEPRLSDYADFQRVFFAGDSAGANIAHHMAIRAGSEDLAGVNLRGIVLIHPYFWGRTPLGSESADPAKRSSVDRLWDLLGPSSASGCDDPMINPATDPRVARLGCGRVLVYVAQRDTLRDRGWYYKEILEKSGWAGVVEVVEDEEEEHVFHLFNPTCDRAVAMRKRIASFLNQGAAAD